MRGWWYDRQALILGFSNLSSAVGFDLNHWVTTIVITAARSRFKSKMALAESLHPGFNHGIIEQACSDVGEVLGLLLSSSSDGNFFSPSKLQQIEALFFKNLPVSEAWATQLPAFVCAEIERMLTLVNQSDKTAAFGVLSTILRIMPLLIIRDAFEEVDAMNKQGKWFQAFVVEATPSMKRIHFMGWQKSHVEDIPSDRFETHIRPRSAACDVGPRGKETSEAIKLLYGIADVVDSTAADAADAAQPDGAAINNPSSPRFLKYMRGFGDALQAIVRSFFSARLESSRVVSFTVELLAFMRVALIKFGEIFKFEVFELFMSESVAAFTKASTEALISRPPPSSLLSVVSVFSNIENTIIDYGRKFCDNEELNQHQQKLLFDSLAMTARNFTRKVISSMNSDSLQLELTALINIAFSFYDAPGGGPDQSDSDKRVHIFHLFRIMNDISESLSSRLSRNSSAGVLNSKELLCRSIAAAVIHCAKFRGAEHDLSTLESQLITLSVAMEWLSLTSSGQAQNGPGALPITHQSLHPYAEAAHESTHDVCIPGAISLQVHFNKKSETHSEAHCITFTSGSLSKPLVYSKKIWPGIGDTPKLKIDGESFMATFTSDGAGSKWGYSFTVTPEFPDVSSLLLLPLRVVITALCFGTLDAVSKSSNLPAAVCSSEAPCLVVSLIEEVHRQSSVGQRFQHLIRGSNSLVRIFKDVQPSLSSLLTQAHATSRVNASLPHVRLHVSQHLNFVG